MASVLPEINDRTRVLALLGNADADPVKGDGWMYADFALLNQLFSGEGIQQIWLHSASESFSTAVERYGPMLHGNPKDPRKVVCDGQTAILKHIMEVPEAQLKAEFLQQLRRFTSESEAGDRPLLILIGHGSEPPMFGVCIGDPAEDEMLDKEQDQDRIISPEDIDPILGDLHDGVQQCIISTCCFAGNWICTNQSRSTMLAVAREAESDSYRRSASDKFRGGVFTDAIAGTLATTQHLTTSFHQLTTAITTNFGRLFPLLLDKNPPVFSAQNNAWHDDAARMTGLGGNDYKRRYDALRVVPPNLGGSSMGDTLQASRRSSRLLKLLVRA